MALRPCPECNNSVSSKAAACPHCGNPLPKPKSFAERWGCLIFFVIAAVLATISTLVSPSKDDDRPAVKVNPSANHATEWYAGGTLHQATMRQWRNAAYRNKLATAADLVVRLRQADGKDVSDIDGTIRREAEWLVRNLDAAYVSQTADNTTVSEAAATLHVMKRSSGR